MNDRISTSVNVWTRRWVCKWYILLTGTECVKTQGMLRLNKATVSIIEQRDETRSSTRKTMRTKEDLVITRTDRLQQTRHDHRTTITRWSWQDSVITWNSNEGGTHDTTSMHLSQFFLLFFFVLRSPAISLGFTTFGWDFCVCDRFFNPTIKVVTFRLRGWCVWVCFCCRHSPV